MRKVKKLTSVVVSLMMVCTSMGGFAFGTTADDENVTLELNSGDILSFSVNADAETTYTLNGETNVYKKITLTGELENGFTVENGEHDIALNNVTINNSVVINPNATANIELEGTNTVKANVVGKAGINVPVGATLNLLGNGELFAKGSDSEHKEGGAGIGGNVRKNAGTINIKGGTITATAGDYAPAIGSADGDGGTINISGGTVNAKGGAWAAGIGGGFGGSSGNITITGGTVNAKGGENGAGIGGGKNYNGGNITIENSEVIATAGKDAEPIGGVKGKVTINGTELSKETREQYHDWGSIKVNPDGTVVQYIK